MNSVRISFTVMLLAILVGCLKPEVISHPASSLSRLGITLAVIGRLEADCRATHLAFCTLQDLPISEMKKFGDFQLRSPLQATFEEFDLQLLLGDDSYCVSAVPTRLAIRLPAEWRDSQGKLYIMDYPWKEVPRSCIFSNRPKLIPDKH